MFPESKWLDALKLPIRLKLAVAAACGALFYLFKSETITVGPLDGLVMTLLLIGVVVFLIVVLFAAAMCFQNHRPPILQPANQITASANASHATSSSAWAMVSLKDDEAIANTNAEEIPTTQRGSYAKNGSIRARLNGRRTITSSTA